VSTITGDVDVATASLSTRKREGEEKCIVEPSDIRSHCFSTSSALCLFRFEMPGVGDWRRTKNATSHGLPTTLGTCQFTSCRGRPGRLCKRTRTLNATMQRARDLALRKSRFTRCYLTHYHVHFARWNLKLILRREKRRKAFHYSFRATLLETGYTYFCLRERSASLFKTYVFSLMYFSTVLLLHWKNY